MKKLIDSLNMKTGLILALVGFVTIVYSIVSDKLEIGNLTKCVDKNTEFRLKTEEAIPLILQAQNDILSKLGDLEAKIEIEKELRLIREHQGSNNKEVGEQLTRLEEKIKGLHPTLFYSKGE